jgi:hypothetical protein
MVRSVCVSGTSAVRSGTQPVSRWSIQWQSRLRLPVIYMVGWLVWRQHFFTSIVNVNRLFFNQWALLDTHLFVYNLLIDCVLYKSFEPYLKWALISGCWNANSLLSYPYIRWYECLIQSYLVFNATGWKKLSLKPCCLNVMNNVE